MQCQWSDWQHDWHCLHSVWGHHHVCFSTPTFLQLLTILLFIFSFEWHQHAQRTGEDPISGGHKGPVQVYIAKAPSTAAAFDGQGAVWTKIYSSGLLNPSSQQWATDIVNTSSGKHSVKIPASLPAGEYLLRAEIVSSFHVISSCSCLTEF